MFCCKSGHIAAAHWQDERRDVLQVLLTCNILNYIDWQPIYVSHWNGSAILLISSIPFLPRFHFISFLEYFLSGLLLAGSGSCPTALNSRTCVALLCKQCLHSKHVSKSVRLLRTLTFWSWSRVMCRQLCKIFVKTFQWLTIDVQCTR